MGWKILKRVTWPWPNPFQGRFFHRQGGTCYDKSKYQIWSLYVHPLWSYEWQCKMQKMGWFGAVRGHSRSWAMPPFDRAHTTYYSTLIETMCLSFYRFRDIASYLSKVADFDHPTCIWRPPPSVEFRGDLWRQKTRVPGLSWGVVCVIPRLAVLVELRLVTDTDRQTDGHRPMAGTAEA